MAKYDNLSEQELEKRIQALMLQRDKILEEQRQLKIALSKAIVKRQEIRRVEVENDPRLKALSQGIGV